MKPAWTFLFLCVWSMNATADDRLWVAAKINGKPAYLIFDTGAERTALFKNGADRLGLKSAWPVVDRVSVSNALAIGVTDEGIFELGKANVRTWFQVIAPPAGMADVKGDGLLGWNSFDVDLLQIDADNSVVMPLEKLPRDLGAWQRLKLQEAADVLALEVSDRNGKPSHLYLDTGGGFGVNLSPAAWHLWRAIHTNQPVNVESYYAADAGFVIMEQAWAEQINLGSLSLTGVPVSEANHSQIAQGSGAYEATLGLPALRRFDLIIDRRHGCAYVRPKTTPPRPYDHNRTGAAIELKDSGDIVIARVVKGSPADEAGLRPGDVLLKVGDRGIESPFLDIHNLRAGMRLEVAFERGKERLTTTLMLRDLLDQRQGSLKPARGRPGAPPGRTNDFSRFKVGIRLRPPDAGDYTRRGFVYESRGQLDEAISNYSRAIQLDAASCEAYGLRGRCFGKKGRFAQAVDDLKAAVSLQPTNEMAQVNLGYVYGQESNWNNAITAYSEAIRVNPSSAETHRYRCFAYEAKGAVKEAFADYSEAIRLDPKDAMACLMRGRRYYMSGEIDQAIRDFSTVITLNPASVEAYQARGYAYAEHGEPHLAVSDLSEAIRLQPTNAWIYDARGNAYIRKGEWEKAVQDYSQAIKLSPSDPTSYRSLAWVEATCSMSSVRNGPAALEAGKKACELTGWKDYWSLTALAAASAETGDFENAVKYEQQALGVSDLSDQDRKAMGDRLLLYQEHRPFYQPSRE